VSLDLSRRSIVRSLMASIGATITQARSPAWSGPAPARPQLIDAHCHVFNATDLPARRFLKIVIADRYPAQGVARLLELDRQDVVDHLIDLMLFIVGQGKAPTAAGEIAVLQGTSPKLARHETQEAATSFTARTTAAYLDRGFDRLGRSAATTD
jgi:hypothetical protein